MGENAKSDNQPILSVVIPVYDEEVNVGPVAEAVAQVLGAWDRPFELIFVDDGSTDSTFERLRELTTRHAELRVLQLDRHAGQTAAFEAGFRAARAPVVATMDGDGQNDPRDLPRLLERLERGDVDMVNGVRVKRHDSWLRRISGRIANAVRNAMTHESVTDVGCSLRVFRRECVEQLSLFDGLHRFFPTLVRIRGFRIAEMPVNHFPRRGGRSKYGVHNRLWRGLRDLFAVRWMQRRVLRYQVRCEVSGSTIPKRETRNSKPETRYPRPETQNATTPQHPSQPNTR